MKSPAVNAFSFQANASSPARLMERRESLLRMGWKAPSHRSGVGKSCARRPGEADLSVGKQVQAEGWIQVCLSVCATADSSTPSQAIRTVADQSDAHLQTSARVFSKKTVKIDFDAREPYLVRFSAFEFKQRKYFWEMSRTCSAACNR